MIQTKSIEPLLQGFCLLTAQFIYTYIYIDRKDSLLLYGEFFFMLCSSIEEGAKKNRKKEIIK